MDWKGFFFLKPFVRVFYFGGGMGGLLFRIEATLGNKLVLSVRSPLPPLSGLIMFLKGKKNGQKKTEGGLLPKTATPP